MTQTYAGRVWAGFTGTLGIVSPWSTSDHLADVTFNDLYPDVDADEWAELVPLSRSSAMAIPAIAKCRHTLVTALAGLPLRATSTRARLPKILADQLDPGRPNVVTISIVLDEMFFYGVAHMLVLARELDSLRPTALRAIREETIERDANGRIVAVDGAKVLDDDVIRIDHIGDGILAPSTGLTLRRARRADRAAARAMDNPVPSIELHQVDGEPLNRDERKDLIEGWVRARRGQNGGVAYTNPSIEAKTHGQAAEQLLINGRNASAIDCARVAGMPAWVVDASVSGSSLTYSNVPSRSREFLDYTARGYLDAIEGRLSMDDVTPHGQGVSFDLLRLLRGDFLDRMRAGEIAVRNKIYTTEEIRRMDPDTPTNPEEL